MSELAVDEISSAYGRLKVVRGVSLTVPRGQTTLLVGHNGAGKSTVLRTIIGHKQMLSGRVRLDGRDISSSRCHERVRLGMSIVPQESGIFPHFTVRENLEFRAAGRRSLSAAPRLDAVREMFPELDNLLDRRAGTLSGGQQRICAIARAVLADAQYLLLDEPSVGLAPRLVDRVMFSIGQLSQSLNVGVLLVEQNLASASQIADCVVVMRYGTVVLTESGAQFRERTDLVTLF
jgi:ABC-type branched-subunit amino acid transport system ATPase component